MTHHGKGVPGGLLKVKFFKKLLPRRGRGWWTARSPMPTRRRSSFGRNSLRKSDQTDRQLLVSLPPIWSFLWRFLRTLGRSRHLGQIVPSPSSSSFRTKLVRNSDFYRFDDSNKIGLKIWTWVESRFGQKRFEQNCFENSDFNRVSLQ